MIDLQNVTLIAVAGVRETKTLKAIKYSKRDINFASSKLLVSNDLKDTDVCIKYIEPLDYIAYNKFVVYELWKYIDTEFALLVQDDGFVVNPHLWTNDFLKYDYIGSPWPTPKDGDDVSYRDPFGNLQRVGNGGFTLRSRKLLSLPTELNLEWKPYFGFYNEDGFFSVHNRHIFEENGCRFADVHTASKFGKEYETKENTHIPSFGFHGKHSEYCNLI